MRPERSLFDHRRRPGTANIAKVRTFGAERDHPERNGDAGLELGHLADDFPCVVAPDELLREGALAEGGQHGDGGAAEDKEVAAAWAGSLTHSQIGDYLALQSETVSRSLSRLAAEGFIAAAQGRRPVFVDEPRPRRSKTNRAKARA